jgi:hypothetical protein
LTLYTALGCCWICDGWLDGKEVHICRLSSSRRPAAVQPVTHTSIKKVDSSSLSVQHIYLVGDRRKRYIHVQSIGSVVTGGQQSKTCWPDIFKYIKDNIDTFVCVCVCRRTPF